MPSMDARGAGAKGLGKPEGEEMARAAARYRPTVNVERAPAPAIPLAYAALGWAALGWAGWRLAAATAALGARAWTAPTLVAATHAVTLGFLTCTMLGFLQQWVPVVFDVPPLPGWLGLGAGVLLAGGLAAFVGGWLAASGLALALGGAAVAAAMAVVTGALGLRILRASDRVLAGAVGLALAGANATWILGLARAWGLVWGTPALAGLGQHLVTALAGWVLALVAAVELKLWPMFFMASTRGLRRWVVPAWVFAGTVGFWVAGGLRLALLVAGLAWAGAAAAAGSLWQALRRRSQAPTFDAVMAAALLGWGLWLAADLAALADMPPLAVGWALTGAGVTVLGFQSRLVPFILALAVARRGQAGVPAFFLARAMAPRRGPWVVAAWGLLAAGLWAVVVTNGSPAMAKALGLTVMAAPVAQILMLVGSLVRARRHPAPLPGLPTR